MRFDDHSGFSWYRIIYDVYYEKFGTDTYDINQESGYISNCHMKSLQIQNRQPETKYIQVYYMISDNHYEFKVILM